MAENDDSVAPTIFWWNNFDRFVDASLGENSHSTPGVAFQEGMESKTLGSDINSLSANATKWSNTLD